MVLNLKTVVKILFLSIALSFMGYYLHKNWSTLQQYEWKFDILLFLLSLVILWIGISISIYLLKIILKKIAGFNIEYFQIFKIFNISSMGRYIPGKLWSIVGFFYLTDQYGISKKQTTLAIIVNEVSNKGSALLLGLCYFIFSSALQKYLPIMAILLAFTLVIIHPRILNNIINFGLRLLKKQPIEINFSYSTIFTFFLLYIIVWVICSFAFYIMVNSITKIGSINYLKFFTIFPFCWVAGYLVIFSPGGLGVREGIMIIMLSEFLSPEVALVIAVFQRIWNMMIEGINFLVSILIPKKVKTS
jgi:hypothetical protein